MKTADVWQDHEPKVGEVVCYSYIKNDNVLNLAWITDYDVDTDKYKLEPMAPPEKAFWLDSADIKQITIPVDMMRDRLHLQVPDPTQDICRCSSAEITAVGHKSSCSEAIAQGLKRQKS